MKRTLLILIALVSMSSLAFAQQQNGNSIGALITRQDVQTELKITP